eukprot:jgi/Mesvir1/580/Mv02024-RA.1
MESATTRNTQAEAVPRPAAYTGYTVFRHAITKSVSKTFCRVLANYGRFRSYSSQPVTIQNSSHETKKRNERMGERNKGLYAACPIAARSTLIFAPKNAAMSAPRGGGLKTPEARDGSNKGEVTDEELARQLAQTNARANDLDQQIQAMELRIAKIMAMEGCQGEATHQLVTWGRQCARLRDLLGAEKAVRRTLEEEVERRRIVALAKQEEEILEAIQHANSAKKGSKTKGTPEPHKPIMDATTVLHREIAYLQQRLVAAAKEQDALRTDALYFKEQLFLTLSLIADNKSGGVGGGAAPGAPDGGAKGGDQEAAAIKEAERLRKETEELRASLAEARAENEKLRARIGDLEEERAREVEERGREGAGAAARGGEDKSDDEGLAEEVDRLRAALDEECSAREAAEAALAEAEERLEDTEQRLDEAEQRLQEVEDKEEGRGARADDDPELSDKLRALEEKLADAEAKLEEARAQDKEKEEEILKLEGQLVDAASLITDQKEGARAKAADAVARVTVLEGELKAAQRLAELEAKRTQQELEHERQAVAELQMRLSEAEHRVKVAEEEGRSKFINLEKVAELEENNASLTSMLQVARSRVKQMEQERMEELSEGDDQKINERWAYEKRLLEGQLEEKDDIIKRMKRASDTAQETADRELKAISTALHGVVMELQRRTLEDRQRNIHPGTTPVMPGGHEIRYPMQIIKRDLFKVVILTIRPDGLRRRDVDAP